MRVIAQTFEIVILPDLATAADAHQAESIRACQHRVLGQLHHIGIDVHDRCRRDRKTDVSRIPSGFSPAGGLLRAKRHLDVGR